MVESCQSVWRAGSDRTLSKSLKCPVASSGCHLNMVVPACPLRLTTEQVILILASFKPEVAVGGQLNPGTGTRS